MKLETALYAEQNAVWPRSGRHILAHFDEETIIVYQAYKTSTRDWSIPRGQLGGPEFSFNRMSWIKPNFLWMMYRCGWASKEAQETVLALRIERAFFESVLEQAVPSSFDATLYSDQVAWKEALASSDARLQWDPDHAPSGAVVERRAIQLGLRGQMLRTLATTALREVIDMTAFVHEQAALVATPSLLTPVERPYLPDSAAAKRQVGLA
ncbi:MAG: DUF4291 domain-containing protein [Hyphomonadaceae bacterium]